MSGSWFNAWRVLVAADLVARQVKTTLADYPMGEHLIRSLAFTALFGVWWWLIGRAERSWSEPSA